MSRVPLTQRPEWKALAEHRRKIEGLKRSIGELQVQRALAELTEMAAGLQGAIAVDEVGLDRLKEQVEDRRDLAVGRTRVARDALDLVAVREDEAAAEARGLRAARPATGVAGRTSAAGTRFRAPESSSFGLAAGWPVAQEGRCQPWRDGCAPLRTPQPGLAGGLRAAQDRRARAGRRVSGGSEPLCQ